MQSAPFSTANLGVSKNAMSKHIKIANLMLLYEKIFNSVPGSNCFTYNRNTTGGEASASTTVLINASASDIIRVRGESFAGGNIITIADGCRLTIESLGT